MNKLIVALLCLAMSACGGFRTKPRPKDERPSSQLLWWCKKDFGNWTVHAEEPKCMGKTRAPWKKFPLRVFAEHSLQFEVNEAAATWEYWMGTRLFELSATHFDADIFAYTMGEEDGIAMSAKFFTDAAGRDKGAVLVFNGYESRNRDDIMAHELGHLLGLKHDKGNPRLVMHPTSVPRVPQMDPRDYHVLRRLYPTLR